MDISIITDSWASATLDYVTVLERLPVRLFLQPFAPCKLQLMLLYDPPITGTIKSNGLMNRMLLNPLISSLWPQPGNFLPKAHIVLLGITFRLFSGVAFSFRQQSFLCGVSLPLTTQRSRSIPAPPAFFFFF